MSRGLRSGWVITGLLLALVGTALRLHNAFDYPVDKGYDEVQNWEYVEQLAKTWTLPAPDAGWSMAHPPLFYGLAAGVDRLLGSPGKESTVRVVLPIFRRIMQADLMPGRITQGKWRIKRAV